MSEAAGAASTDSRATATPDFWQEQLGYVSGTILAWGAVLLQLWPVLSNLQTGAHIHAFGRDEGVDVAATSYYLLALLVALGLAMLLFGAAHVVARGFWFGRAILPAPERDGLPVSDRVARSTYVILHLFWFTALCIVTIVAFSALSALIARFIVSNFGWPAGVARFIAALIAFSPFYVLAFKLIQRRRWIASSRFGPAARRVGWRNILLAYAALSILWAVVIEFSYVARLSLRDHVFSRASDPRILVSTELGGAVSQALPAKLTLIRIAKGGEVRSNLGMTNVASGKYVSILPTHSLEAGSYQVVLTYPHRSLEPAFPYLRSEVRRAVGFVVVD